MKVWHPFTQEKIAPLPIKIARGQGQYLYDENGKSYLDLIASWWVNLHGHANPEIAEAIYEQAKTLEQVIFAGFTHQPAETLAANLSQYLPATLTKFFYSDNGSTAVEIALKMSYQYFKNLGVSGRNLYLNLSGAYHGDTLGAMGASGGTSKYHSGFSDFFFETFSVDCPVSELAEKEALLKLNRFLSEFGSRACALIVEPLIQGAGGMRIYHGDFLRQVVSEVRKHDILVIFDEVMTGFYRTGTMFAMEQVGVVPDLLCLSKGITGGFLPLAATIVSDKIYDVFYSDSWERAFIHGHSYTANPLGCAAAIKSLEILNRQTTLNQVKIIEDVHRQFLFELPKVCNPRVLGTIAAFDLPNAGIARELSEFLLKMGVFIRPLGSTIYTMPPYVVLPQELSSFYEKVISWCKNRVDF